MEEKKVKEFFEVNFLGINKKIWQRFSILRRGDVVWLNSGEVKVLLDKKFKIISLGIPLMHKVKDDVWKPTSLGLIFLNDKIKKKRINLDKEKLKKLLNEGKIPFPFPSDQTMEGYVAISFKNRIIGCGILKKNYLISQIPKPKRQDLLNILTYDEDRDK